MLLNLSKTFAPLYGLSFTKEELYAKMADIAEDHVDSLPRNINFGDKILDALLICKLMKTHGTNNYIFFPEEQILDFHEEQYSVKTEYVILDYSFTIGLNVKIFHGTDFVSSYIRTAVSLDRTFELFYRDKELYAAYCPTLHSLRIMKLPSCMDLNFTYIGDEKFKIDSIWIPKDPSYTLPWSNFQGNFGFVSGSYNTNKVSKIQYLDMIEFAQNKITREDRFGYVELMQNISLAESVDLSNFDPFSEENDRIYIAERKQYRTAKNVGKRERSKNLKILNWFCQNKTCHGSGSIVVNPAHVDLPSFRCTKCLEFVHNVGKNFTFTTLDD